MNKMNLFQIKSLESYQMNLISFICWKHVFLKQTEAVKNDNNDNAYGSLQVPTENLNSHPYYMYPHYPQMMAMALVMIYLEAPN